MQDFVFPDYTGRSLLNLPSTSLSLFGARPAGPPLDASCYGRVERAEKVILFVVDALGVGVGAAIFDERGRILLLQRPESGNWGLPVGFSEVGETAAQGIVREVGEETGLLVSPQRLLGVYDCRGPALLHQIYNVVFLCTVEGGTLTRTDEALDLGYFQRGALPPLVAHHAASIRDAFAAWHDGWQGTAFAS